ncbi:phosphate uptake regulator PhoU [Methanospirillum purgamenti]|nr:MULTISPECIES: phosphate uptake regulator PhoU [Methanospirillum]
MEIRRVQMTGGSSYVITLPKDWIESTHIKKNDPLGIMVQPDGTLLITKNTTGDQIQRIKNLEIESGTDPDFFLRILIGVYIAGYNAIHITTKDRMTGNIRMKLREFSNMVIGPEFIEETDSSVLIKDLLNPLEMPIQNSLKRMFVIVKGMYTDAIDAFIAHDSDLISDVIERDNDVDRLFWLIARQTNMIMHNVHLSKKMNVNASEMLPHFQVARIIERVGDHSVRIAKNAHKVHGEEIPQEIFEQIRAASMGALKTFEKSVESFFTHDLKKANKTIEYMKDLEDTFSKINTDLLALPAHLAVPVRNITDSIRRSGEYSADISENVINYEMMIEKKT